MTLNGTLFIPDLESNLFYVRSATKKGVIVVFDDEGRITKDKKIVAVGDVSAGLYNLQVVHNAQVPRSAIQSHL